MLINETKNKVNIMSSKSRHLDCVFISYENNPIHVQEVVQKFKHRGLTFLSSKSAPKKTLCMNMLKNSRFALYIIENRPTMYSFQDIINCGSIPIILCQDSVNVLGNYKKDVDFLYISSIPEFHKLLVNIISQKKWNTLSPNMDKLLSTNRDNKITITLPKTSTCENILSFRNLVNEWERLGLCYLKSFDTKSDCVTISDSNTLVLLFDTKTNVSFKQFSTDPYYLELFLSSHAREDFTQRNNVLFIDDIEEVNFFDKDKTERVNIWKHFCVCINEKVSEKRFKLMSKYRYGLFLPHQDIRILIDMLALGIVPILISNTVYNFNFNCPFVENHNYISIDECFSDLIIISKTIREKQWTSISNNNTGWFYTNASMNGSFFSIVCKSFSPRINHIIQTSGVPIIEDIDNAKTVFFTITNHTSITKTEKQIITLQEFKLDEYFVVFCADEKSFACLSSQHNKAVLFLNCSQNDCMQKIHDLGFNCLYCDPNTTFNRSSFLECVNNVLKQRHIKYKTVNSIVMDASLFQSQQTETSVISDNRFMWTNLKCDQNNNSHKYNFPINSFMNQDYQNNYLPGSCHPVITLNNNNNNNNNNNSTNNFNKNIEFGLKYVITSFFLPKNNDERKEELMQTLKWNIENPQIHYVILVFENNMDIDNFMFDHPMRNKIIFQFVQNRPTYLDLFTIGNDICGNGNYLVVCNSDISFDTSLINIEYIDMRNVCLALLRHNIINKDKDAKNRETKIYTGTAISQDVWIFKTPLNMSELINSFNMFDFVLGVPGCDNVSSFQLQECGYSVWNCPKLVKVFHLHSDNTRNYSHARIKKDNKRKRNSSFILPQSIEKKYWNGSQKLFHQQRDDINKYIKNIDMKNCILSLQNNPNQANQKELQRVLDLFPWVKKYLF